MFVRSLLAVLLLGVAPITVAHAAEPAKVGTVLGLEDRLKTGLKARRPEENAFLEEVARLVRKGELPVKLVDSTYLWALQRQQKYPYPLFERAIRIQAGRIGVDL
ncbi:MAG: hypothetical protein ACKOEM_07075 [Planctomycetia bacterium]